MVIRAMFWSWGAVWLVVSEVIPRAEGRSWDALFAGLVVAGCVRGAYLAVRDLGFGAIVRGFH